MLEVEAKARLASPDDARRALRRMGAEPLGAEEQRDAYFAHPARDFARTDEALRLRQAAASVELTYKGPKLDAATKTREELTVRLESPDEAARILERLGFRRVAEVRKRREAWALRGLEVALDEVDGLGAFVEVEGRAEHAADVPAVRDAVLALLKELGGAESIRTSYLEMLLAAQGKA